MQEPLDYRGLRRWSMLILFPVLLVSSWVAALLMLVVSLPMTFSAISAVSISGMGFVGIAAVVMPPVIGTIFGLLGIAFGKGRVVRALGASRVHNNHPLTQTTHRMAARLGMPPPEVYVYPDDDVNAWAVGSSASTAAIGLTRGALDRLSNQQIDAVIGHELGHIAAGDNRRMQFAISFQNALVWFFGFPSWRWNAQHIFGFVGQAGIMGMSRRREYWADALGAILTSPEAMEDALRAVAKDKQKPAKKRRYYNQLMFNWHGGSLLASHPTFDQRLAALQSGHHYQAALRKMGNPSRVSQKRTYRRPGANYSIGQRMQEWAEAFDRSPLALTVVPVVLLAVIGFATYHVAQLHSDIDVPIVQAEHDTRGPQVAGWSKVVPEAAVQAMTTRAPSDDTPIVAALPVYPKEPRYEPDDASGDGELTPYQMLVEEGIACIYRAKLDDSYGSEHLEDAGPDKSDLMMYTYPAAQAHSELLLGMVGAQATGCWKRLGAVQREPDMMKRVQQPYDVWVLTDATSGAMAECGIWPVARTVRNGKGGIAAYCR